MGLNESFPNGRPRTEEKLINFERFSVRVEEK